MATWTKLGRPEGRGFRRICWPIPEVAGRVSGGEIDRRWSRDARAQVDGIFARVFGEPGPAA